MHARSVAVAGSLVVAAITAVAAPPHAAAATVASQTCTVPSPGAAVTTAPLDGFEPVTPTRLVDTRDGTGGVGDPVGAGCVLRLDLDATVVPADAAAVALSVTAISAQRGFLSVFPCSAGQPPTSNLNARGSGIPTPNLVVATPDAARDVCIFSQRSSDLLVDLTGWWLPDGSTRLVTVTPVRAEDTRTDPGRPVVPARTERVIELADIVPDGTRAVVGNLTITEPVAGGFATAYPCGQGLPLASNLNYVAGESRAVAVVVGIDAAERLCVQANVDAHVVFDVSGYYEPTPQFGPVSGLQPQTGRRLADSRSGQGGWTGKFAAGATRRLTPTAGLPNHSQSTAAVLNVVVTEADADGFLTIYPCDRPRPTTSVVNFTPAGESTNLVVVDLANDGEVCVYAHAATHVVVDLFGVLAADDGVFVEELSIDGFTWPAYTPDGTDYVVECDSRTDLGITLLRGATARVNGVPVGSGGFDVATAPNDRFRVELRRDGVTRTHWFRCVPSDFPRLEIERPGQPSAGWYVTTIRKAGAPAGYAVIMDTRGVPVWYKRVPGDLIEVLRREDGRMVFVQSLGPRYGVDPARGYVAMSLFGTLTEELTAVPVPPGFDPFPGPDDNDLSDLAGLPMPTDHHGYVSLPNGARALLVYPVVGPVDLTVLGPGYTATDEIADGVIQEIAADDTLVWAWQTSDHFGFDVTFPQRWGPLEGYTGNEVDIFHLNSLQRVTDGTGDYVASGRHMDNVFRVDRATGAVDWVVGEVPGDSPQATKDARLTIVGDPRGGPRRPHDARLEGDVLTMFDNRTETGQPARAVAYEIDEVGGTATLLWSIEDDEGRTSAALGSNRVTPAGTVLVSWGAGIQPVFGEYLADGEPLIEITQVGGGNAFRIVKEPLAAFDAAVLRAAAGGDVELP